ncbi:hypothetical protein JW948_05630 [bacterium]|nr:hypothetical protein [bacterium]
MKTTLLILMMLFASSFIEAGNSAGHSIRFRIIRPNTMSLAAADKHSGSTLNISKKYKSEHTLFWRTAHQNKLVTVSSCTESGRSGGVLIIRGKSERLLSDSHRNITESLHGMQDKCTLIFKSEQTASSPVQLVYTLTES